MKNLRHSLVLMAWLAACCNAIGWAQSGPFAPQRAAAPGIVVSGIGIVKARPDQLRIDFNVQGKAEITDDALVKYHDARRRLNEAVDKLKLPNLRINDQKFTLSTASDPAANMAMMNGGSTQGDSAPQIEVSGSLQILLTGLGDQSPDDILKTLGKVLDTIKDAGANFGPSPAERRMAMRFGMESPAGLKVRFMVHDFKRFREQAYERAVEDARGRAARLAALNGLKLGRVAAVQESQIAGDSPETPQQSVPWYWGGGNTEHREQDEILTDDLEDVPVTVRLVVRFDIADGEPQPSSEKSQ